MSLLRRLASSPACGSIRAALGARTFSVEGIRSYKDKESAEENIFFKREEIKMLKSLAANARRRQQLEDPKGYAVMVDKEKRELKQILSKYNVSEETLDKLVEWRDQPH